MGGEQHERGGHREQAPNVVAEHDDSGRDLERDRRAHRDRVAEEECQVGVGERAGHKAYAPEDSAEEHHGMRPEALRERRSGNA